MLCPCKLYGISLKLKKIKIKIQRRSKLFSDYVHQKRLSCDFMVLNVLVSDHFLNAHGHFFITCLPPFFKRLSDINENFLKKISNEL